MSGTRNALYQDMNGRALKIVGTAFLFVIAPKLTEAGADWREFQPPGQTFNIKMPAEITQSRAPLVRSSAASTPTSGPRRKD